MSHPAPGPVEIDNAHKGKDTDAIPYADLRLKAKQESAKQKSLPSEFKFGTLKTVNEVMVALDRAQVYRDQRAKVRAVFKNAIERLDTTIKGLKPKDPRKMKLDSILKALKSTADGHEKAIEQATSAFLSGKKILEALKKKERWEQGSKQK